MPGPVPSTGQYNMPNPGLADWVKRALASQAESVHAGQVAGVQGTSGVAMPTPPPAPRMFSARTPYETPDSGQMMARLDEGMPIAPSSTARGGFTVDDTSDFGPEREAFLARGSSPEIGAMADAFGARAAIRENATSGRRPDLLRGMQSDLALQALENARTREQQQLDPSFGREQRALDTVSQAKTFMHPALQRQRGAQQTQEFDRARELQDINLEGQTDPRALGLLLQKFLRDAQIARIQSEGRNPLSGLLGMGGGDGEQPQVGEQRRTRDGRVVTWDGQGWALQD